MQGHALRRFALFRRCIPGGGGRQLGAVAIKTAAAFAAKVPGGHQFLLHQRRGKARVLEEGLEYRFGNGVVDVLANQIGQLQRPHGEAPASRSTASSVAASATRSSSARRVSA